MTAYIWHPEWGYFVGECLGFGFFEKDIKAGDISPDERPIAFESSEQAQEYLGEWRSGPCGCIVTENADLKRESEEAT